MLPVFLDGNEADRLPAGDEDFHVIEAVTQGHGAEGGRVFPEAFPERRSALKPGEEVLCALAERVCLSPAVGIHSRGRRERFHLVSEFPVQIVLQGRHELLAGKSPQSFRKGGKFVQFRQPAFSVAAQPVAVHHDIGKPAQTRRAHGKVKIPDRTAVQQRVIRILIDKKAEALDIPLDHEILHNIHFHPGFHIQIVVPVFPGVSIFPIFVKKGRFRLPQITGNILPFF